MTARDGNEARILLMALEAGHQPCARHRQRVRDRWATWRVDVDVPAGRAGTLRGTTAYVCDGCLGPWVRSLIVRWAPVVQARRSQPARERRMQANLDKMKAAR